METVIERKGLLGRERWVLLDGALVSPEDLGDAKIELWATESLHKAFRETVLRALESRRSRSL